MSPRMHHAYNYTTYGYRRSGTPTLGFCGEAADSASGGYILGNGHRLYSPILMRFYSPDSLSPFGQGGMNLYAYCGNEPVNWRDPSGQMRTPNLPSLKDSAIFTRDTLRTAKRALTRGPIAKNEFPLERAVLLECANKTSRPFNDAVNGINLNLATHGDASLSQLQAQRYIDATWSNQSNTYLFTRSAYGWLQRFHIARQPEALAGFALNLSGAFGAGVFDHKTYKTGQALTQDFSRSAVSLRQRTS